MKKTIDMNGLWTMYYSPNFNVGIVNPHDDFEVEKTAVGVNVPCNAETALADAGVIDAELFRGMKTQDNMKFEDYHWWFEKEFDLPEIKSHQKIYMKFDMVDCIAEYYINDKLAYSSDNAFRAHVFEVSEFVKSVKNTVVVHIKPALPYILSKRYAQGNIYSHQSFAANLRKPVYCFGWDIMPRTISAGITRDVSIVIDDGCKIDEFSWCILQANEDVAIVRFYVTIDMPYLEYKKDVKLHLVGKCGDDIIEDLRDCKHFNSCVMGMNIKKPKLWWPYGYGDANVYDLTVELIVDGEVKDIVYETMGIRSVKLDRSESVLDANPRFRFYINEVPIMCKGSNWVPTDPYQSRTKQRYKKALELASECGCNILRVWGGGVYEQKEFYDYCDRHGIMIWHDFMMACYSPARDEKMISELKKEFEWAVKTLRNHPSIVLWSGDNEVDTVAVPKAIKPDANAITRKIIPEILSLHDKTRPYIPSSPYVSSCVADDYKENFDVLVENHLWGTRDYFKSNFYKDSKACFVSEIGYHGCPAVESVRAIVDDDKVWPIYNEQWSLHSSDQSGSMARVRLMDEQITQLFGIKADNIEDFATASQISQAEAKKFFIENFRMKKPYTGGVMWWNLIDGWPQMSDAVVDYFYNKKLAYYYIKHSQEPFALMIGELRDWNYPLYAENDTLKKTDGKYSVFDIESNEVLAEGEFSVSPNSSEKIDSIRMYYSEHRFLVIKWSVEGKDYYNHYLCGMPPFSFGRYKKWLSDYRKIIGE